MNAVLPALTALRREQLERAEVEGWCYRVDWEPVAVPDEKPVTGRWLLLQMPDDVPLAGLEQFIPGLERLTCDALDRKGLARLLEQAVEGEEPAGMLSCLSLPPLGDGRPCRRRAALWRT